MTSKDSWDDEYVAPPPVTRNYEDDIGIMEEIIKNNDVFLLFNAISSLYDASIIQTKPISIQNKLKKIFKEKYDENSLITNKTELIFRLIYNHFKKNQPHPIYIGGPKTISYQKNEYKNIYIFGEQHSNYVDCPKNTKTMNIENYLLKLIQTTDCFLDIFIELPSFSKTTSQYPEIFKTSWNDRLGNLLKKLYPCIEPRTRNSQICKLARIHYIDIRSESSNSVSLEYINNITNNTRKFKENYHKYIQEIFIPFTSQNLQDHINFWYNQIDTDNLIQKQFNKLNQTIKQQIETYYKELISSYLEKSYINISNICQKILENPNPDNIANKNLYFEIINISSVLVDIYTISRIFKTYSPRIRNAIIYAGNGHANHYRDFLKSIGFNTEYLIIDKNYQNCLELINQLF
jgi:hypothetical protein